MELRTNRLLLRPICQEDAKAMFKYRSDAETNQYQGWIPETEEDVIDFIGRTSIKENIPETWFQLVIVQKTSDELIGDIGIHFLGEENLQVEIGYTVAKHWQGKGFATEAVSAVLHYLFERLKKYRVTASLDPDNIPSIKLLERLGFRKEAHFKKSIWLNDEWVDDLVYALLKEEWEPYSLDTTYVH